MDKPWVSKWVILRGIWSLKRHASISVPLFECDLDRTDRGRAAASLLAPERTTKTCAVDAQYCPVLKGSEVSQLQCNQASSLPSFHRSSMSSSHYSTDLVTSSLLSPTRKCWNIKLQMRLTVAAESLYRACIMAIQHHFTAEPTLF